MSIQFSEHKEIINLIKFFLIEGVIIIQPCSEKEIKIKNINGEIGYIFKDNDKITFKIRHFFEDKTIGDYNWEIENIDHFFSVLKHFSNSSLLTEKENEISKIRV